MPSRPLEARLLSRTAAAPTGEQPQSGNEYHRPHPGHHHGAIAMEQRSPDDFRRDSSERIAGTTGITGIPVIPLLSRRRERQRERRS